MRAFIIRPFGTKRSKEGTEIDFDRVERELIDPALCALKIDGRTTQEITRAGNIRVDMLEALVTADLVVADISIHNANAFYELGVRHALREKRIIGGSRWNSGSRPSRTVCRSTPALPEQRPGGPRLLGL